MLSIDSVKLFSYAKCNLTLKVLGKRPDGFHNLESDVAMLVNPVDFIELSNFVQVGPQVRPNLVTNSFLSQIEIESNLKQLQNNKNNLISKALTLSEKYFKNSHISAYLPTKIKLTKNIPIFGGLGGGSSNAAAVLIWCSQFANNPLKFLFQVGPEVGSDVLACCFEFCKMLGRGEIVKDYGPIIDPTKQYEGKGQEVTLLLPKIKCETKKVFEQYTQGKTSKNALNDLLSAAKIAYPELGSFIGYCQNLKVTINMLGSGSTFLTTQELSDEQLQNLKLQCKVIETRLLPDLNFTN